MGVVLETQSLRNDLKRKAFRNEAASQKHPMPPEQLLGPKPRSALHGILKLAIGQIQSLRHPGDRKTLGLREIQQVAPIRAQEPLTLPSQLEGILVIGHWLRGRVEISKRKSSFREFTCQHMLT